MIDSDAHEMLYDSLESLCARVVEAPAHEWTRGALNRVPEQRWLPLAPLIQTHSQDQGLALQAAATGYGVAVHVVVTPDQQRRLITFYCSGLDAVTGTALIEAGVDLRSALH